MPRGIHALSSNRRALQQHMANRFSKEKYSRNPVLSSVELCMGEAAQYLKKDHICRYEMNPGGHFTDPDGRMLKGIAWLIDHLPD